MSLVHRAPASLRRRAATSLPSHQQRRYSSPFFALGKLSNARETQHFTKASKLSRVEHSPPLKLIQTSEVDPFAPASARRTASGAAGEKDELRTVSEEEWTAALQGLSSEAQKEIWREWNEGKGRSKSFAEIAREWREKQQPDEKMASWVSLPDEARRQVWREWSEGDRAKGLAEMAAEWMAKHGSATNTERDMSKGRISSEQNVEATDGKVAGSGQATLGRRLDDERALRAEGHEQMVGMRRLQDAIENLKQANDELRAGSHKEYVPHIPWYFYLISMSIIGFVTYKLVSLAIVYGNHPAPANEAELATGLQWRENVRNTDKAKKYDAAKQEAMESRRKAFDDLQKADAAHRREIVKMQAEHEKQVEGLQGEVTTANGHIQQINKEHHAALAAEKKVQKDQQARLAAHEATMAEWSRKAEELKHAIEKKDVGSLSKAEQNAYLEALVFLQVKDRRRRSWTGGWFWREE